jgi:hypothetical protein
MLGKDIKPRLIDAADYLDNLADDAEHVKGRWIVDVAILGNAIDWLGPSHDALTATWPQAALIAVHSPQQARLQAKLLRTMTASIAGDDDHTWCVAEKCAEIAAVELADAILPHRPTQSKEKQA